jgi:hypothetical protein
VPGRRTTLERSQRRLSMPRNRAMTMYCTYLTTKPHSTSNSPSCLFLSAIEAVERLSGFWQLAYPSIAVRVRDTDRGIQRSLLGACNWLDEIPLVAAGADSVRITCTRGTCCTCRCIGAKREPRVGLQSRLKRIERFAGSIAVGEFSFFPGRVRGSFSTRGFVVCLHLLQLTTLRV